MNRLAPDAPCRSGRRGPATAAGAPFQDPSSRPRRRWNRSSQLWKARRAGLRWTSSTPGEGGQPRRPGHKHRSHAPCRRPNRLPLRARARACVRAHPPAWASHSPRSPQTPHHVAPRTQAHALERRVPVVLHGVVCPPGQQLGNDCGGVREAGPASAHSSIGLARSSIGAGTCPGTHPTSNPAPPANPPGPRLPPNQTTRPFLFGNHSLAHLLPWILWLSTITASSHASNGSFLTCGFSWLHHLVGTARRGAAGRGGGVSTACQPSPAMPPGPGMTPCRTPAPAHRRRQLLPDRPSMPPAMMLQFLGPNSWIRLLSSSSS